MKRTLIIILLISFIILSCSAETRHRVLSSFFDGVPVPSSSKRGVKPDTLSVKSKDVSRSRQDIVPVFSHPFYEDKECEPCHIGELGNELAEPANVLCFDCHEDFSQSAYIHGPVAVGSCVSCHTPHKSNYPHLVLKKTGEVCACCHEYDQTIAFGHKKSEDMECTYCHDPHSSMDSKFFVSK